MRATQLVQQMTVAEKVGQLVQTLPSIFSDDEQDVITGPIAELLKEDGITDENRWNMGSVIGISNAKQARKLQESYLRHNRLGIPLLFMADIIHGHRTIFPVPLAMACSWDLDGLEQMARTSSIEATASGLHVTFSPMADLSRDPRWGRVMESTGEDVWLNGEMAAAFVRGYQTNDLTREDTLAACVKHFAAYGAPEGGRDYNTVDVSDRELREYHLPAYKRALEEGAKMVMTSFNVVHGVPATASEYLMRDILRSEWGFEGVLISDWTAIKELIHHGVAETLKDAGELALRAGVDIDMMSGAYSNYIEAMLEEGIDEALLDEAVLRILTLKEELGLFDNPYRGIDQTKETALHLSDEHRDQARRLAEKSAVLLKNDGVLPLQKQRVALIGPFADSNDVLGPWAGYGKKEEAVTLRQAFDRAELPYTFTGGATVEAEIDWTEACRIAEQADVIVLALGEASWMSGEAGSRTDIRLPKTQREGLKRLKALGKPVVTILFNGRPLDLRDVVEQSDAVLEAWYPGTEAGSALVNLLYGQVSPSGKLTMSFPYNIGQVPIRYDALRTGRPSDIEHADPRYTSKYLDAPNEPLFPFGYGMTYTTFSYNDFIVKEVTDGIVEATVVIRNDGATTADEIVQWYIQDKVAKVSRPVKQLKGYDKVTLEAGESVTVTFTVEADMLRYLQPNGTFDADPGTFTLFVGPNSRDVLAKSFELKTKTRCTT
ncbi:MULTISPECIES: glycoside hydrolase family 3 N-terminal domain-containing protein [unclassified Exiguobacterium]|uniref:glycoside hydrolase family 3 N-terminal domain-containing protein n=1 Tax=unclassified Exiguobacterium TaxID=2644629 RepID=UPI00103AD8BB|nr:MULTISPECIES: glycoside hydrolase family 3 N-terminal domain-containing protein [unclassified Exiguobacterium]TCI43066.1 beta-glucosidase [Exiguobacterium sp. SH5S32]TCI49852.1 beta-glucosidase [Exiguobacterium sp. SH1S4]TCI68087.1 beta-glucosidase [Exiguobacterium sp. SH1S1]